MICRSLLRELLYGVQELGLAGQPVDVQRELRRLARVRFVAVGFHEPHHHVLVAGPGQLTVRLEDDGRRIGDAAADAAVAQVGDFREALVIIRCLVLSHRVILNQSVLVILK